MSQRYAVYSIDRSRRTLMGNPHMERIPHLEGKLCDCGKILPLSHQGPCSSCGGTSYKERAIPNLSDLRGRRLM